MSRMFLMCCSAMNLKTFTILSTISIAVDAATKEALPMLTCSETTSQKHISLPTNCSQFGGNWFSCTFYRSHGRLWTYEFHSQVLKTSKEDASKENNMTITLCFGIGSWSSKASIDLSYDILFLSSLAAGVIVADRTCWEQRGLECIYQVKLRADVMNLPPFIFFPNEEGFWDFSSPLLRADLGWLRDLALTGEQTSHYPAALRGLAGSSLEQLEVSGNLGTDLQGHLPALRHLPRLIFLQIDNNTMEELTPEQLEGTEKIQELHLTRNQFTEIPTGIKLLKNLSYVMFQSMKENFTFNPQIFSNLNELDTLILYRTQVKFWNVTFPTLPNLRYLYLNGCGLQYFSTATTNLPSLFFLDLSDNALKSLSENAFYGVPNLGILILRENFLSYIPDRSLTFLSSLSYIDLGYNKLTRWPELGGSYFEKILLAANNLSHLVNLGNKGIIVQELDISKNFITHWEDPNIFLSKMLGTKGRHSEDKEIVSQVNATTIRKFLASGYDFKNTSKPSVSLLNLSYNHIAIFSEAMVKSMAVLTEVDLGDNLVDCGVCETSLLKNWLDVDHKTKVKVLGSDAQVLCHQPEELRGSTVQSIDFDELCFTPRRHLWWSLGAALSLLIGATAVASGVVYYYRTELAYLGHLAKIRANSKRTQQGLSSYKYDAFVCYSGRNRKWVMRRLTRLMERPPEHYQMCLFDRDFRLGTHIVSNIVEAIDQSRKVVVVLTQHFIVSKWCQWELEMANHKLFSEDREFLVLLQLEPLERARLPRLLRFLLDTRPVVRWPRPETAPAVLAAAAQLRRALGPSLRQRRAAPAAATPPLVRAGDRDEDRVHPGQSGEDERTPLLCS